MLNLIFIFGFTSLCLWAWIWFCNVFSHQDWKKLMILSGISGLLTGWVMLIFPYLCEIFFKKDFLSLENNVLGISLAIFCLIVISVYASLIRSKFLFFMLWIFFLIFALIIFWPWGWIFSILLFAFVEEALKFGAGYSMREKNFLLKSDIILFLLIAGFWFAWIENIRYGFLTSWWVFGLMAIRWAVGFLAHWSFSSIIGYIWKNKQIFLISWIIIAFLTHSFYNFVVNWNSFFSIIFALAWYFWLTFVLEKSDSLYLK